MLWLSNGARMLSLLECLMLNVASHRCLARILVTGGIALGGIGLSSCSGGGAGGAPPAVPPVKPGFETQAVARGGASPPDPTAEGVRLAQLNTEARAATLPQAAYVVGEYTTSQGSNIDYTAVVYVFNTSTNAIGATPIVSVAGEPQASALSRDAAILYLSLPTVSASTPSKVGTLEAFSVSPTSGKALGKVTYSSSSKFDLAYAGTTTGKDPQAYVYTDTSPSSASMEIYTPDLKTKIKGGPSLSSAVMDYVLPAPSSLNAYTIDKSGTYRLYNAGGNDYILPLSGVTSAVSPGIPVLAVTPTGSTLYGLVVNRTGLVRRRSM